MVDLFISTLKPPSEESRTNYRIDDEVYANAMRQKWQGGMVYTPKSEHYLLRWELKEGEEKGILGGLQTDQETVSFGFNYVESALEYIIWHREFVPSDVELYLFDANLLLVYELTPESTSNDLDKVIKSVFG